MKKEEIDAIARDKFEEIHWNTNSVDEPRERALMKMKWFRMGFNEGVAFASKLTADGVPTPTSAQQITD